jgi:iron(III) transport system ATP-binding protein
MKRSEHVSHWEKTRKAAATIAAGLSLSGVTRIFTERIAVNDFSFDIRPGEIISLLGPSGCGKSTLLRMIAGIDRPDSGRIVIGDVEVSSPGRFQPPEKRGVGLMFQDFALFPHLTVIDNVAFGLKRLGRSVAKHEAAAVLSRMGLAEYASAYPHMLSGGQQQRVALARAIAPRPGVLLMDEPFSGLDGRLRDEIRNETLAIIHEVGATAIFVTHDPEEAMRLSDRIAIMSHGRLVQAGTVEELYHTPRNIYVAETFSELNIIPCRVISGWAVGPLGRFRAPESLEGEILLCLRPHHITIENEEDGIAAHILQSCSVGRETLIELGVSGLEKPLIVRADAAAVKPRGSEVHLGINAENALFFPRT